MVYASKRQPGKLSYNLPKPVDVILVGVKAWQVEQAAKNRDPPQDR
jgi:ketopantoate reductase